MQQQPMNFQEPMIVQQQSGSSCTKPILACVLGPLLLLGCLVGAACACVFVIARGNPDPLYENYEPEQALADNYENRVARAVADAPQNNGQLELTMREDEFSSWLNIKSDELFNDTEIRNDRFGRRAQPTDIQVRFDDQEVQFFMVFDLPFFDLATLITAEVSAPTDPTSDSVIEINLTGFKLGSIDVLSAIEGDFEADFGDIFVEQLRDELEAETGTRNITITAVDVDDGIMQLSGIVGQ